MTERMTGLLLFAHGARDPAWARPFEAVARTCLDQRPDRPVALAFLEFMQPGLVDAGARLAQQGCGSVDVVPLFLGAGGHVRKDIPMLLDALATRFPEVTWRLRSTVGESPGVIAAMAQAALSEGNSP